MNTFQSIKRSISPQIYLVHFDTPNLTETLHFEEGVRISGAWFNVFSRQMERMQQMTLPGSVTLHLAQARNFPKWCYLQLWDERSQGYGCSCYERRSAGYCSHIAALQPEVLEIVG